MRFAARHRDRNAPEEFNLQRWVKALVPRQVQILRIQFLETFFTRKTAWLRPRSNDIEVTIISAPIPEGFYFLSAVVDRSVRASRQLFGAHTANEPGDLVSGYGGSSTVLRSLRAGLKINGVAFNYNPADLRELSQNVLVLTGASALRQMIKLKQQGYIRRLLIGPTMSMDPASRADLFAAPEVDRYLIHSQWRQLLPRMLPSIGGRSAVCESGVDVRFWCPTEGGVRNHVLIYDKQIAGATAPIAPFRRELEHRGYAVSVIQYGHYDLPQYLSLLQSALFMVGFTRSEMQGVAWAEAWACDVPTFIWRNAEPTCLGVAYGGSTAPCLTDETGKFFADMEEFRALLGQWEKNALAFHPRRWCIENMSDEVCAGSFLAILESI